MSNHDSRPITFLAELKKRNLWKSLVGFPAGAFIILQVVDFFIEKYGLPPKLLTATLIVLVGFLPIVLIWNWQHGEDGHQHMAKGMPAVYFSIGFFAVSASVLFYLYGSDPSTYNGSSVTPLTSDLPDPSVVLPDKSIAILPFEDMSKSQDQEYFGDGMAEEIINALADLKHLIVAGRTSSFAMKDKGLTISQIGEILKVKTVLQGSIRKDKDKIRISVQLSETENGYQIWSNQFDKDYDDLFEIQNEIAIAVKERLELDFMDLNQTRLIDAPTFSKKAYELYLKGNYHSIRPPEGTQKAIDFYKEAIMIDPDFAEAHYKLAWVYNWQAWGSLKTSKEAFNQAYPHAQKAYQLNNKYCREIINYYLWHKFDFARAEEIMKASGTEQDNFYMVTGDYEQGMEMARKELASDPFRILSHMYIIHGLALTGDEEGFKKYAEEIRYKFQDVSAIQWVIGSFGNIILEPEYALSFADEALALADRQGGSRFLIPYAQAKQGKRAEVLPFIAEVKRGDFKGDPNMALVLIYEGLGEIDLALDHLEKAYEEGEYLLVYTRSPYFLPSLNDHPRFKAILDKIAYHAS